MDTTKEEKLPIRFIDLQGTVYLRKEDVVRYLYQSAFRKPKLPNETMCIVLDIANAIHYYTGNGEID